MMGEYSANVCFVEEVSDNHRQGTLDGIEHPNHRQHTDGRIIRHPVVGCEDDEGRHTHGRNPQRDTDKYRGSSSPSTRQTQTNCDAQDR